MDVIRQMFRAVWIDQAEILNVCAGDIAERRLSVLSVLHKIKSSNNVT
jgi:hypothetical protein